MRAHLAAGEIAAATDAAGGGREIARAAPGTVDVGRGGLLLFGWGLDVLLRRQLELLILAHRRAAVAALLDRALVARAAVAAGPFQFDLAEFFLWHRAPCMLDVSGCPSL